MSHSLLGVGKWQSMLHDEIPVSIQIFSVMLLSTGCGFRLRLATWSARLGYHIPISTKGVVHPIQSCWIRAWSFRPIHSITLRATIMSVPPASASPIWNDASQDYSAFWLLSEGDRKVGYNTGVFQGASELKLVGVTGIHHWHKVIMGVLGFHITLKASPLGLPSTTTSVGIPSRAVISSRRRGGIRPSRFRQGQ